MPLAATDILLGFQTKMIDVVPTTPIAALSLQWYRQTPYMIGLGLAPLVGGVVLTKSAWEKVSPEDQALMLAAARDDREELEREVPRRTERDRADEAARTLGRRDLGGAAEGLARGGAAIRRRRRATAACRRRSSPRRRPRSRSFVPARRRAARPEPQLTFLAASNRPSPSCRSRRWRSSSRVSSLLRQLGGTGVPGALPLVQHLTLWLGFLGATYAAREGKLLAIAASGLFPDGRLAAGAAIVAGAVGAAVSILLARGPLEMVRLDREAGGEVALGIPIWVAQLVLPIGFAVLALRLAWSASPRWSGPGSSPPRTRGGHSLLGADPSLGGGRAEDRGPRRAARRRDRRRAALRPARWRRGLALPGRRRADRGGADRELPARGAPDAAVDAALHPRRASCSPRARPPSACSRSSAPPSAGCRAAPRW